jgi:hypothetical protein
MKTFLLLAISLTIATTTRSQESMDSGTHITKEQYQKKGRTQAIIGWSLAGTGTALIVVPLCVEILSDATVTLVTLGTETEYDDKPYTGYYVAGAAMLTTGIAMLAISKSNKNKARALTATFKMENSRQIKNALASTVSYPALSLRLKF